MANETEPTEPHHPDDYRMTVGEHLEELRRRLIYAVLGFAVAAVVCLIFGQDLITIFCKPAIETLRAEGLPPVLVSTGAAEGFNVYLQLSLIIAAVFAAPWTVYQFWLFIAAGLYKSERKMVMGMAPLSITLLIAGWVFVYLLVLPWTLQFFVSFNSGVKMPTDFRGGTATTMSATTLPVIPILDGDPAHPAKGAFWMNGPENRIKVFIAPNDVRTLTFGPTTLIQTMLKLDDYIDLVMGMLLVFGLSFQLPLVIAALGRAGIVDIAMLKSMRRYVYIALTVVASVITPGDVITATVALLLPLCLLYELGILLAMRGKKSEPEEDAASVD